MTIDDAEWLDSESATVLGFVARRLYADGIVVLVAVRDPLPPQFAFDGPPLVTLGVLREGSALELLAVSVTPTIAPQVRTRILAEAGGNPLALIELGRGLSPEAAAGTEILLQPLVVGERSGSAVPRPGPVLCRLGPSDSCSSRRRTRPATRVVWHVADRLDIDESAMGRGEAENLVRLALRSASATP